MLNTMLPEEEQNFQDAPSVTIGVSQGENEALKEKYDEMHSKGPVAWFSSGVEERALILSMGQPWAGKTVLEIGCGEGDLCHLMQIEGAIVAGVDYSEVAISKAEERYPEIDFAEKDYRQVTGKGSRVVLQGVLEHLDDPFKELLWIMENLVETDLITSSPAFVNPRGFVWMALDAVGAKMSKTDLHFLNPWDFEEFCKRYKYTLEWRSCDFDWANGKDMVKDLIQRIPLALKDGNIPYDNGKMAKFIQWLEIAAKWSSLAMGATAVYRISK